MTKRLTERLPRRDYRTLDAIVVIGGILLVGGGGVALIFVEIPGPNLPILASLITGVLGILLAYTGARWGNKKPTTDEEAGSVTVIPPAGTVTVEPAAPDEERS